MTFFYPYNFLYYPFSLGYTMYGMWMQLAMIPVQFMQLLLMMYVFNMFSKMLWR